MTTQETGSTASLLAGVRIVDTSSVLFGPYATQVLGDLGADVIKVESFAGDNTRHIGPARHEGMSAVFMGCNRNKRSIAVDLKHPEGRQIALDLSASADVFVTNIRRQAVERLGLGYADVAARNKAIVYCNAVGYSEGGPYENEPAFDDTIQAMSGLAALQGVNSGEPCFVTSAVADKISGLMLALAIVAALRHRDRSGEGQQVEVPMFETMVAFNLVEHLYGRVFDPPMGTAVYPRVVSRNRRPHRTTDGHIAVMPYTDDHWRKFFEVMGRPELATDHRFATIGARTRNIDELYSIVATAMGTRSLAEWLAQLRSVQVPAVSVKTTDELFDDPHLRATGFFEMHDHPTEGRIMSVGFPVRFSRTPVRTEHEAPRLGQHTKEILLSLGYSHEQIEALIRHGAIVGSESSPGCEE